MPLPPEEHAHLYSHDVSCCGVSSVRLAWPDQLASDVTSRSVQELVVPHSGAMQTPLVCQLLHHLLREIQGGPTELAQDAAVVRAPI